MQKKIAYGGIGAALMIAFLFLCVYLPTGNLATMFCASLTVFIITNTTNKKTAFISYLAVTLLGFFVLFSISPVEFISYALCFGNYPILKTVIDSKPKTLRIVLKLILYTVYFAVVYFLGVSLIKISIPYSIWILYFAGVLVFFFYDWLILQTGVYALNRFFKRF